MKTRQEAKEDIDAYIRENSGIYPNWYVGITADPEKRLFNDHNVIKKGGVWIHVRCTSTDAARDVETYFINEKGTKGGPGGGDDDAIYVYAYKITPSTREKF